jgi:adenylate kinase family enzyme
MQDGFGVRYPARWLAFNTCAQQCVHWTAGTRRVFSAFSQRKAIPVSEPFSPPAASNAKPLGAQASLRVGMKTTIILIGPLGAGKTTVGHLLAKKLDLPFCSVDNVRSAYYERVGYDKTLASEIAASEQGIQGVLGYSKPFEVRMIEEILADHHGIIDFGASNSVYDDSELFARIEKVLAPNPNVILLLPSPNVDETAEILKNRLTTMLIEAGKEFTDELFALNEYFIKHPSNQQLAKLVVYTKGKTPEEICNELMPKIV